MDATASNARFRAIALLSSSLRKWNEDRFQEAPVESKRRKRGIV
jgi:hypothetical protein